MNQEERIRVHDAHIRSARGSGYGGRYNLPYFALASALGIFVYAVVSNDPRVWSIVPLIMPAVFGSAFAERNARDIRNGTVEERARRGAHKAIEESGVVTRDGPTVTATLEALNETLEALHTYRIHDEQQRQRKKKVTE